jgi:hypothetical protein
VRVTNSATPPNPVMGVSVAFQSMIFLPDADVPVETSGDDGSSQHAMKVLLGSSQTTVVTHNNGLASLAPSTGGFSRPLEVEITASAGTAAPLQFELPMLAALTPKSGESTGRARLPGQWGSRAIDGLRVSSAQRMESSQMSGPLWSGGAISILTVGCNGEHDRNSSVSVPHQSEQLQHPAKPTSQDRQPDEKCEARPVSDAAQE